MKRTIALLTTMAMMLLLATSVAMAGVITCSYSGDCFGTIQPDTIYGGGGNNTIDGYLNTDYIYGGNGNDIIQGGWDGWGYDIHDKLDGGEGNDTYTFEGGWGVETITADASGSDTIDFSTLTDDLVVDLIANSSSDEAKYRVPEDPDEIPKRSAVNWASTGLIEAARGGEGSDSLSGTNGNNYLYGNNGDDKLFGRGGKDLLSGGPGNDTINANDYGADGGIYCGDGYDTVTYDRDLDFPGGDCEKKPRFPLPQLRTK